MEPLTSSEIVEAALRVTRLQGFDRLTMRAIAAELQVTPMALYHHVSSKDELVKLVAGAVSSALAPLELAADGWEASLRRYLLAMWENMVRYPGLVNYQMNRPSFGVGPGTIETGVRFFEDAGFAPRDARLAWSFAMTYVHGRLNIDRGLRGKPDAGRMEGIRTTDYVTFGVDAVIRGLRELPGAPGGGSRRRRPA